MSLLISSSPKSQDSVLNKRRKGGREGGKSEGRGEKAGDTL